MAIKWQSHGAQGTGSGSGFVPSGSGCRSQPVLVVVVVVVSVLALCGAESAVVRESARESPRHRLRDLPDVSRTRKDDHHLGPRASRITDKTVYRWNEWSGWSEWSDETYCSKSCGIGIRKRKRKCYKVTVYGKKQVSSLPCPGKDTEYRLCNTQKCKDSEENDTRMQACAAHNKKYYRGRHFIWKMVSKELVVERGYSPCALVCQAQNYPFQVVAKLAESLPDGTTCRAKNTDGVCINKQCIPIGCDVKLYSTKTYDVCGVCGGNNKTCDVISGHINRIIRHGYTTLLTIPRDARHIVVSDRNQSSAVFALRGAGGIYFVSGKLSARFPTEYPGVANTTFFYHHSLYEPDGMERIESSGPTNETLYVMMLSAKPHVNIAVDYMYTMPKDSSRQRLEISDRSPTYLANTSFPVKDYLHVSNIPGRSARLVSEKSTDKDAVKFNNSISEYLVTDPYPDERFSERLTPLSRDTDEITLYTWVSSPAAHCSITCNNGVQTKYARCVRRTDGQEMDDSFCDPRTKPPLVNDHCVGKPCKARWEVGQWEPCSTSCGEGHQTRSVRCWRLLQPGFDSSVLSRMCEHLPKPAGIRRCTATDCGPVWQVSAWSECSSKCGRGIQKRAVLCSSKFDDCDFNSKPISFRQCSSGPCYNKWVVSKWSACSGPCGVGLQYRRVSCVDPVGGFVDNEFCDHNRKPLSVQACGERPNCPPVWVAQTWGACSVNCGDGLISRDVVCGEIINSEFQIRNERKCSHLYKPATRSRCRRDPCPPQWFTSEWSKCSQSCGTDGYKRRRVSCYTEDKPSQQCDESLKPAVTEPCNRISCEEIADRATAKAITATKEDVCVDKEGINCSDVVLRHGCNMARYRKLCCRSCKTANATYQNLALRTASLEGATVETSYPSVTSETVRQTSQRISSSSG